MSSSIADAFQKALSKTQTQLAQPIPAEWDDETTETTITEVQTKEQAMNTQPKREYFKTTNNVTRVTFDCVRDNPGLSRVRIVGLLAQQGYKKSSTTSLLGQMVRQGLVRENDDALFVTQKEYTPLKQRLVRKPKAAAPEVVAKPKRKYERRNAAAKAAAYEAHENYNPTALDDKVVPHKEFSAEDWVNSLTLKQAKAVYEELRKIFG